MMYKVINLHYSETLKCALLSGYDKIAGTSTNMKIQ